MEDKNIIAVKDFNGKYKINEHYRPIAEALKEKFKELQWVPVSSNMIEKMGVNWNSTKSDIPDILVDGVEWDTIEGPMNLFQSNPPRIICLELLFKCSKH